MKFKTEKEYEDYLENLLLENNWEVLRQQPADECQGWENPYTLDLMIRNKYILKNQWIGLELKNFEGISKGGKFWDIIKQIKKYTYLHFKGYKIKYWCVAIPNDNLKYNWMNNNENNRIKIFLTSFLNSMGVGILELNRTIKFCTNNGNGIIDLTKKYNYHNPKTDFIDNIIENQKEWDINFEKPQINPWKNNKKCSSCGGCLDIEEIKFDNRCPYCNETIFYKPRTKNL